MRCGCSWMKAGGCCASSRHWTGPTPMSSSSRPGGKTSAGRARKKSFRTWGSRLETWPNCSTGRSPKTDSAFSPAGLLPELIDLLRGFRLGEILLHVFPGLSGQGVQIRLLRPGHWLFTGSPIVGILDGVRLILRCIPVFISLARHRFLLALISDLTAPERKPNQQSGVKPEAQLSQPLPGQARFSAPGQTAGSLPHRVLWKGYLHRADRSERPR